MRTLLLRALAAFAGLAVLPAAQAAHEAHTQPEIRVGVVLFDGAEPIDYVGPYEVFAQAGFAVATVSEDGKPIHGLGLQVVPDYSFANAPGFDVILVPGGDVDRAASDKALLAFLQQRTGGARQVMSVCTGAFILASAGLLDGGEATTFKSAIRGLREKYPKVHVRDDVRWADNGKVVTSAGLSSGIDTALHVLAKLRGEDVARSVALRLEYDWKPRGGFVRAQLADRDFPDLDKVDWPADAKFGDVVSLGDERRWRVRAHIATQVSLDDLTARIDAAIAKSPGWSPQPRQGPHHWRKTADGRVVDVAIAGRPSEDKRGYDIEATLVAAPARGS